MKLRSILYTRHDERGSLSVPLPYQGRGLQLPKTYIRLRPSYILWFALTVSALFTTFLLIYVVQFFTPKQANYSYSGVSCFANPLLLPNASTVAGARNFNITHEPSVSIGSFPLYSQSSCVAPSTAPLLKTTETLHLHAFGLRLLDKKIAITSEGAPSITVSSDIQIPTSAKESLTFSTNNTDTVFAYHLATNDAKISSCNTEKKVITCPLVDLNLAQGTAHSLHLERMYKNEVVEKVLTTSITTLEPLEIASMPITEGQKVYESLSSVAITFTKELSDVGDIEIQQITGDKQTRVAAKTSFIGSTATVVPNEPLARSSTFTLDIKSATATDKSTLKTARTVTFTTSGGPVVTGTNIGTYKIAKNSNISVNFDVGLNKEQNFAQYIALHVGGVPIAITYTLQGGVVTINPTNDLPHCSSFTVIVSAGLTSIYGVENGKAWQYTSRTICQTTYSIGVSTLGKQITAYSFGSGPSKVLYVGGTHGNEKSSVHTLQGFIEDLELNYANIPAHRTVVVVPNLNPDAFMTGTRLTSRGVDLNRNFEANNWQTDVYIPPNTFVATGGGTAPLSEPESAALAQLTLLLNPRLVLTYHAVARVVISNDAGDSYLLAQSYGAKSAYPAIMNSASHDTFEYDSTGEYEDWLHDKHDIPALLIELATMSSNEFNSHKTAMWSMAQLAD